MAVHGDHLEGEIAGGHPLTCLRQMTEPPQDVAGEGRVAVGLVDQVGVDQARKPGSVSRRICGGLTSVFWSSATNNQH